MDRLVDIQGLRKSFGPIEAVKDVSFSVNRGEVLGFLGPNGAGKSTTMKMVTCYLTPTAGTATVCGHDILKDPLNVRKKIGYLPEGAPAYGDMTAIGFLKFVAEVRGFSGAEKKKRIDRAVELVGLEKVLLQSIETLSKGFKRRVGLAQAILHDPEVLILDEPTDGLDPNQKHEVRNLIANMASEKVIILSTHILEEVDAVCSRSIIIAEGSKIFDGTPNELLSKSERHGVVVLEVSKDDSAICASTISELEGVKKVETVDRSDNKWRTLEVIPSGSEDLYPLITQVCSDQDWNVKNLTVERGRYDDVFRQLTLGDSNGRGKES